MFWVPATRTTEDAVGSDFCKFSNLSLGTWFPSFEQAVKKKYEITGLLRPAFEVYMKESGQTKKLEPSNAADANPLCLFTIRRLELRPSQLCALH